MHTFVLRTADAGWIARNGAADAGDGRVAVKVPTVDRVTFAGREWLRHTFVDVPADALNAAIMCPVEWVTA